ncbi:MAG TPA: TrmH family RNA methyltransferase [Gemmatimonadales bacterium]|jgi:tRNA (cytidine/uridine-2'-O-)-methyltransferase
MPLHVALLEPRSAALNGDIARRCAAVDASLHLVAPAFEADDAEFLAAGPADWEALDWWIHPGWRDFRDAMSRERCLYFSATSERDPVDAPFKPNSVLVFGSEELGLPDKICEKYPDRVFGLPRAAKRKQDDPASAVELTLKFASQRGGGGTPEPPAKRRRR